NCPSGFTSSGSSCGVSSNTGVGDAFWYGPNALGSLVGSQMEMIPGGGTGHQAAGFLYQTQVNVQAFTSTFSFVPNGQNLAWVLNNSTNNPTFNNNLFVAGAGCEAGFFQGYSQPNPPNNVFAMEFDSVNPLVNNDAFTYSSVQIYTSNPYVEC